jgi:hypothetical protein
MSERKPISKKLRFEIFKRDGFTCQYCGKMSPDVVLEVDHIKPVASGGKNDMLNLVTACLSCNRGKGATELKDESMVIKQQKQLTEANERRLQLQMMLEWKAELARLVEDQVDYICGVFFSTYKHVLQDHERQNIKSLINRFGFNDVCEAVDISILKYNYYYYALEKLGGVCYNRKNGIRSVKHGNQTNR